MTHARILALTTEGWSANQIAAEVHVCARTVHRVRVRAGVGVLPAPPLSDAEIERAAALLDDGCSYAEVARTLGRDERNLAKHLPNRGWTRRECALFRHVGKESA